jgi:putative DNA primase/helicase
VTTTSSRTPPYLSIMISDVGLDRVTLRAVTSLKIDNAVEPRTFQFGTGMARLRQDGDEPLLEVMGTTELKNVLGRTACWYKTTPKGRLVETFPPDTVVRNVLAEPDVRLARVDRIVTAPVFALDGSFDTTPGYQRNAQVFYAPRPGFTMRPVPADPTPRDVEKALSVIFGDVLVDFPFDGLSDRAHAVAGMLLPFVRNMVDGPTPLHLVDAPARGSGKTLLAQAMIIPSAEQTAVATEAKSEEEWRKRIGAVLSTGPQAILFDNLKNHLDSAALDAVLTAELWSDRLLGRNDKQIRYPNKALWVATGNGVTLSVDLARRTVPIGLDANMELPHTRPADTFKHRNLQRWMRQHRGDIVWACAVLIRRWIASGRPEGDTPPLGSFESWTATIGGILEVVGIEGFLTGLDEFRANFNPESSSWGAFVDAWWDDHRDALVRAGELVSTYEKLDDDFLGVLGHSSKSSSTTLGMALLKHRNTIHGDYRIVRSEGKNQGGNRWRLKLK